MPRFFSAIALLMSALPLLFTSCRKPEIRVYLAPRDTPPAGEQHSPDDGHDHGAAPRAERPRPKLTWTLPADWKETAANNVSVAIFSVKSGAGEGTISITPLPNLEGQEALVVNMYRQQTGLPPIEQNALGSVLQPVEVAGGAGKLLEIDGTSGGKPVRILTAIAHRDGQSWFYRLSGDDAVVTAQKPAFLDFIKSVRIEAAPAPAPASTAASGEPKFNWTVPPGWTPVAAGQMQAAKFAVPESDGAKAEMSVSIFPNDTGGLAQNIQRWRGQLGLPAVDDATATQAAQPLEGGPAGAQLVELKSEARTLLGAIVPRDGRWFFYKLMGDAPAVNAQREAFVQFAKSPP